ncbi:MFS transporter [Prevotella sp. P6B1]|uniref:MFS transporter n=1 Tax=Prevotella sp. P6B1 TaxID=1410613 RepID=UPI00051C1EE0|nr:MFS transporter [Prevotella sp. P6B1]
MTSKNQSQANYLGPFLTMVFLFLIVGFLTTANGQFQGPLKAALLSETGNLKNTLATLITFSWFLAYPVCGSLGSKWIVNYGYKGTLIRGLLVMITGLLLFFLSAKLSMFFVFLLGSFVAGASATILQVVINPYLTACSVKGTQAVQRLAIGGTANSVGTTTAPYFVSGIVFGGLALEDIQACQLMIPFLMLAAIVLLIVIVLLHLSLPDIEETHNKVGDKLEKSVWSFPHLVYGVVSIFFYVGCEVCIGTNINLYVTEDFGMQISTVTLMATLYWGGLLVGRLFGSTLCSIHPRTQLTFATMMASLLVVFAMIINNPWILVTVGLFHSIMWGAIFTLSVAQLGKYTSAASGVFMIGVVGGAILPLIQGFLADWMGNWRWSWSIVLFGELVMLLYARVGSRVHQTAE